jgi:hypothetical protein
MVHNLNTVAGFSLAMCDTQFLQKGWFLWQVMKGTVVKPKQ